MKLLDCPMNGPRNIDEFQSFGPLRQAPDTDSA
ncbi:MAG: sarcosine oxidase subunit delta, partial [Mesorhizobium sp.]